jgi:hypothetical protein
MTLATELKAEATALIYQDGLNEILRVGKPVYYTGSYFLDVMAWRDLDIELSLEPDPFSITAFFALGAQIASAFPVNSMAFYNRVLFPLRSTTPLGLYWSIQLEYPATRHLWNIDLWSFAPEVVEANWSGMQTIAERIDARSHQIIVEWKQALLSLDGRTPKFSGYYLYQAILFEKLTERQAILDYLQQHGVTVPEA